MTVSELFDVRPMTVSELFDDSIRAFLPRVAELGSGALAALRDLRTSAEFWRKTDATRAAVDYYAIDRPNMRITVN